LPSTTSTFVISLGLIDLRNWLFLPSLQVGSNGAIFL
jgi:hypothetical protein